MKRKLRMFAVILSAMLVASAGVSCKGSTEGKNGNDTAEVIEITQTLYKQSTVSLPADYFNVMDSAYVDGKYMLVYYDTENIVKLCTVSPEGEISEPVVLFDGKFNLYTASVSERGITLLVGKADSEEVTEDTVLSFRMLEYNNVGELIGEKAVSGLESLVSPVDCMLGEMLEYGENSYLVNVIDFNAADHTIAVIDENGSVTDSSKVTDYRRCSVEGGQVMYADENGFTLLDGKTADISANRKEFSERISGLQTIISGRNGFLAYAITSDYIYGISKDGTLTVVVDSGSSVIDSSGLSSMTAGDNNCFMGISMEGGISLLTPMPEGFKDEDRETITLCMSGHSSELSDLAREFSRGSEKYKVVIKSDLTFDDIKEDILSGDAPDIIENWDISNIHKLCNMGALVDMYELMDSDAGLNREDILPNVLEAFEYKEGLYMLPNKIQLQYGIANSEVVGKEYTDCTYEEFYEIWENRPEGMLYSNYCYDKEYIFAVLCTNSLSHWIDTETGKCNFNSGEFVKLLDFCYNFDGCVPMFDFENANEQMAMDYQFGVKNKDMLCDMGENGLRLSSTLAHVGLSYDEATILNNVGAESGEITGSRTWSIASSSDCIDGAWEFISFMLGETVQSRNIHGYEIPVNAKAFEKAVDFNSCTEEEMETATTSISLGNATIEIEYNTCLTEEQMAEYREYILSCTSLKYNNEAVSNICLGEFQRFINGDISAQECAEAIQSRAEIYLSETS